MPIQNQCQMHAAAKVLLCCSVVRLLQLQSARGVDPVGHLKPLGTHAPGIEIRARDSVPGSIEFLDEYTKQGKPVILRGAAREMTNFHHWNDDKYLRKKFGDWLLSAEVGTYENSISGKFISLAFDHFVALYKRAPIHIIQRISPDNPMREEMFLPQNMACGGYKEHIKNIMLYMSAGTTTSALRMDHLENMYCVFDGTKEWIAYDRNVSGMISLMDGQTDLGAVNCNSVDMYKYPIHRKLPWYRAIVNAGDCFYLPWGWMHSARSSGPRNLAISFEFGPIRHQVRLYKCPDNISELPNSTLVPRQILSFAANVRNKLWPLFSPGAEMISRKEFSEEFRAEDSGGNDADSVFSLLDLDKNGYITLWELDSLPEEVAEEAMDLPEQLYYSLNEFMNDRKRPDEL